jgi:hypothetical protein
VGYILEEEQRVSDEKEMGELKKWCIDTWREHGPQPYDPDLEELSEKKQQKKIHRDHERREKAVAAAASKEEAATQPKFPIGWGRQVAILSHRSIRYFGWELSYM